MEQEFQEVDFQCLIGNEWTLIGQALNREVDGLWLKDLSAVDAASWVDDKGKPHEIWVHPTSTPTKPVLPFPFTLAQFKAFCDWHPTFEWEAVTSVFTNDDNTLDEKNLAFVESRSRAAGVLVRYIIGQPDDEYSRAWEDACDIDDIEKSIKECRDIPALDWGQQERKTQEIAALKAKRDALRANVFPAESQQPAPAQDTATPAPVVAASDGPVKPKRRTWQDIAMPYMVDTFKSSQYTTAKEFYRALEKKAGPDSPFNRGTGPNSDSLYVREISQNLTFKTVQNVVWPKLKTSR